MDIKEIEKIDKEVEKIFMRDIGRDMKWKAMIKSIKKKMKKIDKKCWHWFHIVV